MLRSTNLENEQVSMGHDLSLREEFLGRSKTTDRQRVKALEQRDRQDSTTQRDKACEGKVPLFIRYQASSRAQEAEEGIAGCDGRQTFKVLVPRAIRGLRKKVHEELQQYLDLDRHRCRRHNERMHCN